MAVTDTPAIVKAVTDTSDTPVIVKAVTDTSVTPAIKLLQTQVTHLR